GAEHGASKQRDREQRDQDDARAVEQVIVGEHDQLEECCDEEEDGCLEAVHQCFGTRTITDCNDEKSTKGWTWRFWNGSTSLWLWLVTVPTGMPRGNIDGSAPLPSVPAVITVSPTLTYFVFATWSKMSTSPVESPRLITPTAVGCVRSFAVTALVSSVS